jgi:hypothetical protein
MNRPQEPIRHLDPDSGTPEQLREMLRAACEDGPNADQLARMVSHLMPITKPISNNSPSPSGPGITSIIIKTGIVVVATVATVFLLRSISDHRFATPTPSTDSLTKSPDKNIGTPNAVSRPREPLPVNPQYKNNANQPELSGILPHIPPKGLGKSTQRHSSDTSQEIGLLREAKKVLPHDASEALLLTERHRLSFPKGKFEQEREAIAIEALLRLGQKAQAEGRATTFYSRFPNSTYQHRIRVLFGQE